MPPEVIAEDLVTDQNNTSRLPTTVNRSLSERSHLPTCDSDSEDEWSEDEEQIDLLEGLIKEIKACYVSSKQDKKSPDSSSPKTQIAENADTISQRDIKLNYTTDDKNNSKSKTQNDYRSNTDTYSTDSDESDTSNEDDSEDEGNTSRARAPGRSSSYREKKNLTFRGKPYDKNNSPNREETSNDSIQYGNSFTTNQSVEFQDVATSEHLSFTSDYSTVEALLGLDFQTSNVPYEPATGSTSPPVISIAPYINENQDSLLSPPNIQSPTKLQYNTVRQPLSSASSSNLSDSYQPSPNSYYSDIESSSEEQITGSLQSITCNDSVTSQEQTIVPDEVLGQLFACLGNIEVDNQLQGEQCFEDGTGLDKRNDNYFSGLNSNVVEPSVYNANQYLGNNSLTGNTEEPLNINRVMTNTLVSSPTMSWVSPTHPGNTSMGIVTVNSSNNSYVLQESTIQTNAYNTCQTTNSPLNTDSTRVAMSVSPQRRSTNTSTSDLLIPETVELHNQSSMRKWRRNSKPLACWDTFRLPATSALMRLVERVGDCKTRIGMSFVYYDLDEEEFVKRNYIGDTTLMTLLRDPKILNKRLHRFAPFIARLREFPGSLITATNQLGEDALYLAATNCPEFDFITGILIAEIVATHGPEIVSTRKYNDSKNDTLMHAVAAKGDTHVAIMRELLAANVTLGHNLFDVSRQNSEGKTPLHVAIEAQTLGNGVRSEKMVQLLMEYDADPGIREYRNGNTALHQATLGTCASGLVQALLRKNAGHRAVNIANYAGNTPVHLAAAVGYPVHPNTQATVCRLLIDAGGRTNIPNLQHKMPLALVAADRRETIKKIFYKQS